MMDDPDDFTNKYPTLSTLITQLDRYLEETYPEFFGRDSQHPYLKIKPYKVIHDNLWGTNQFSWCELAVIDSPIMQRLKDIHQVGLAFYVYPSARHTRFEHCLGTAIIASRIFESLLQRERGEIRTILQAVEPSQETDKTIAQLRQDLRLAALLHDTGHSLFSHASEQVYQDLNIIKKASEELTRFVGKTKGAGEVISFCIARTNSLRHLIKRAKARLSDRETSPEFDREPDLINVSLFMVGRSKHPFLQFIGDIVSSGFDADKLDYLLRDAISAGLPLRYDIDRYLYSVRIEKGILGDGDGNLQEFFKSTGMQDITRHESGQRFPFYETYRLRLPREAMNTIEQIVICKLMLYSYIYHHAKCRAAEGMLVRMLKGLVKSWRNAGDSDLQILTRFLNMTDSALRNQTLYPTNESWIGEFAYRLINRLLPREVYRIGGAIASHAERTILADFLLKLQDIEKRDKLIIDMEKAIGEALIHIDPNLGEDPQHALLKAGVWFDVPKVPKFEDIHDLVSGKSSGISGVPLVQLFPIDEWTQAYTHYRYYVRIYAFSEYWDKVQIAAKNAMQNIIKIGSDSFYEKAKRTR